MSGTAIAAGLPCGMWREHTKKFSPQVRNCVPRCSGWAAGSLGGLRLRN